MPHLILTCYLSLTTASIATTDRLKCMAEQHQSRCTGDRGQATTEYALVLLAAALVALLVVAWATAGGGAARVSRLFNAVIDSVISNV
tara:strand:+ start:2146 stop:2409 length:264 start_codon:yes stop_codon:yes gene_type:complete